MTITTEQEAVLVEAFHVMFDIKDAGDASRVADTKARAAWNALQALGALMQEAGIEQPRRYDGEGRNKVNVPNFVVTDRVAVDELRAGDMIDSQRTITGYIALVRGGAKYGVSYLGGSTGTAVFDRRKKVSIMRGDVARS